MTTCIFCGNESEDRLCGDCAPCREMMLKHGDAVTRDGNRFYRIRRPADAPQPSA